MLRLAVFLFSILLSHQAAASLYRIEVTGAYSSARLSGGLLFDPELDDFVYGYWSFTPDDPEWPLIEGQLFFLEATSVGTAVSGHAYFDGTSFERCLGILSTVCAGLTPFLGPFEPETETIFYDSLLSGLTSGFRFSAVGGSGGLAVGRDLALAFSFELEGKTYYAGTNGYWDYSAAFTDVKISEVPLPSGVFLSIAGLSALGAIGWWRRRAA